MRQVSRLSFSLDSSAGGSVGGRIEAMVEAVYGVMELSGERLSEIYPAAPPVGVNADGATSQDGSAVAHAAGNLEWHCGRENPSRVTVWYQKTERGADLTDSKCSNDSM